MACLEHHSDPTPPPFLFDGGMAGTETMPPGRAVDLCKLGNTGWLTVTDGRVIISRERNPTLPIVNPTDWSWTTPSHPLPCQLDLAAYASQTAATAYLLPNLDGEGPMRVVNRDSYFPPLPTEHAQSYHHSLYMSAASWSSCLDIQPLRLDGREDMPLPPPRSVHYSTRSKQALMKSLVTDNPVSLFELSVERPRKRKCTR